MQERTQSQSYLRTQSCDGCNTVFVGVSGEKTQVMLQFTDLWENICFTTLCPVFIHCFT